MKTVLLLIILFYSSTVLACKCRYLNFSEEIEISSDIFVGKVIGIDSLDKHLVSFRFQIIDKWKGNLKDTISFTQRQLNCDKFDFILNDTYTIYADKNSISICSRTKRYKLSPDNDKLNKRYNKAILIADSLLLSDKLTNEEAEFINNKFNSDNSGIMEVFAGRKYLFADTVFQFDKFTFFNYYKTSYTKMTVVSFDSKKSPCDYDGILYFSNTSLSSKQKRNLQKRLKKMPCL